MLPHPDIKLPRAFAYFSRLDATFTDSTQSLRAPAGLQGSLVQVSVICGDSSSPSMKIHLYVCDVDVDTLER